jgi:hypothetical protein
MTTSSSWSPFRSWSSTAETSDGRPEVAEAEAEPIGQARRLDLHEILLAVAVHVGEREAVREVDGAGDRHRDRGLGDEAGRARVPVDVHRALLEVQEIDLVVAVDVEEARVGPLAREHLGERRAGRRERLLGRPVAVRGAAVREVRAGRRVQDVDEPVAVDVEHLHVGRLEVVPVAERARRDGQEARLPVGAELREQDLVLRPRRVDDVGERVAVEVDERRVPRRQVGVHADEGHLDEGRLAARVRAAHHAERLRVPEREDERVLRPVGARRLDAGEARLPARRRRGLVRQRDRAARLAVSRDGDADELLREQRLERGVAVGDDAHAIAVGERRLVRRLPLHEDPRERTQERHRHGGGARARGQRLGGPRVGELVPEAIDRDDRVVAERPLPHRHAREPRRRDERARLVGAVVGDAAVGRLGRPVARAPVALRVPTKADERALEARAILGDARAGVGQRDERVVAAERELVGRRVRRQRARRRALDGPHGQVPADADGPVAAERAVGEREPRARAGEARGQLDGHAERHRARVGRDARVVAHTVDRSGRARQADARIVDACLESRGSAGSKKQPHSDDDERPESLPAHCFSLAAARVTFVKSRRRIVTCVRDFVFAKRW